ncbi:efflux RND transporter periplasmic adaptor subunit [Syntrophobacter fumaroxidans]|nr:efflux RND transporter periplasmic adaptor subunit [Syntrophobacter fumaroxidans]
MQKSCRMNTLLKRTAWLACCAMLFLAPAAGICAGAQPGRAAAEVKTGDILLQGKLMCPLKRQVAVPFRGIVTTVKVHAAQAVKKGEVLARYRLGAEVIMQLRRRLSPSQISEMGTQLAEIDKNLSSLEVRRKELRELSSRNMAPAQSLNQVEKEIQLASRHRVSIESRLRLEQQLARDDLLVLKEQLGQAVNASSIPEEVSLVAPIDGYVIAVSPDLREGAEVGPGTPAFIVGAMDPMVMRSQVHEMDAIHVAVGDKASVSFDSIPGKTFEGKVSRLSWSPAGAALEQPSYYEMEVLLPNPDLALKDGFKGQIVLPGTKATGR